MHSTRNLPRTLAAAREAGWLVAGAALERSTEVGALDASRSTVLVLGSEGRGLRTNVLRECDAVVRISRAQSAASAVAPEDEVRGDYSSI